MRENINSMTYSEMAQKLKRTENAIAQKACQLQLRRPENKGQFGKRFYTGPRPKVVPSTAFKPGNIPPQYRQEGEIWTGRHTDTTRCWWIKKDGKVQPMHRYVWQQEFGRIPPGYVIRFINGNTLDYQLENLQCISRKELMCMNSLHRNKPKAAAARWAGKRDFVKAVLMCEV